MVLLMIATLMVSLGGFAAAEQGEADETAWYELSGDKRVVTVRVPSMLNDACEWNCVISNEEALEVLTSEDTSIESEDGTGEFAVSFFGTAKDAGDVAVALEYIGEIGAVKAYTLELSISKNGEIKVVGYSIYDGMGDWLTLTDDDCVINVNLPANATTGYAWSCEISDPKLVANVSEEYVPDSADDGALGVGGLWNARFEGTQNEEGEGGDVTLTFRYQRGVEAPVATCVARMWLVENGQFEIVSAMAAISSIADAELAE